MNRKSTKSFLSSLICFAGCLSLHANEAEFSADESSSNDDVAFVRNELLTRSDALPEDVKDATDPYLEGYIQALVDMHFFEYRVIVTVKDHHVYLANLPANELISDAIISFVRDLPGVKSVEVKSLTEEEKRMLLKFVTSRSRTPLFGFKNLIPNFALYVFVIKSVFTS